MEHSVKSFTRTTKSGKTVTVKAHTRRSKGGLSHLRGERPTINPELIAKIRENRRAAKTSATPPRPIPRTMGAPAFTSGLKLVGGGRVGGRKKGW